MRTNGANVQHMAGLSRKSIILVGTEVAVLGVGAVIGDLAGYALVAAGSLAVLGAWLWPVIVKQREKPELQSPTEQPSPIMEVARAMYDRASQGLRDMAVTVARLSDDDTTPSDYFVSALTVLAGARIVTIQGRREPGLTLEPLPFNTFETATLRISGGNVIRVFSDRGVEWYDLHVLLSEALKGLAEYEIDARRQELNR